MSLLQFTFATAVSSLSDYEFVPIPGHAPSVDGGTQAMRMFVEMAGATAGDETTVRMILKKDGYPVGVFDAACTATAVDGAYGKVATVVFAESGTSVLDMLGTSDTGNGNSETGAAWVVGALTFGGTTTGVRVYVDHSEEI